MNFSEKYLAYRGDIRIIEGFGPTLYAAARHPEKQPVGIWVFNMEKASLARISLDCGASALAVEKGHLWAAGNDGKIYDCPTKGRPISRGLVENEAAAIALLSDNRLAVLIENEIVILSRKNGEVKQRLQLSDTGTCLAADESGIWLAAGTVEGSVSVFECEDKSQFCLSESDRLHEGSVTALTFSPEKLMIVSAGLDQKLLVTYARGRLEPEDRARGAGHTDRVITLIPGHTRFYSAGADKVVKAWPVSSNARPLTQKDGLGKIVDLTIVSIHEKPHIVAVLTDNSFRLFPLDEEGKFKECSLIIRDAYALAANSFKHSDPGIRESAIKDLAGYNDSRSLEMIAARVTKEKDPGLRVMCADFIGKSGHIQAPELLEKMLKHSAGAVRIKAFEGLRKLLGKTDLRSLDLALSTGKADIGIMALDCLEKLAADDDQALKKLTESIHSNTFEIRRKALLSLESVRPKNSPEGTLAGLKSKHADIRRMGAIRLFQRKMLEKMPVPAALRTLSEDSVPNVRQCAFLLSLTTNRKLADTIRSRDIDIHRHLFDIEHTYTGLDPEKAKKPPALPKVKKKKFNLAPEDYSPLLQAVASLSVDTCLAGAKGLALLEDSRALGLLLQLSREKDVSVRVEVCKALALLNDPRTIRRLRSFLNEEAPEVRDAAFSGLILIYSKKPLECVQAGFVSANEDVRHRGLKILIETIRKGEKKGVSSQARKLLLQAMNDFASSVRSEAFKAALNLRIDGGHEGALRFVLNSAHADIRREVLTEIMTREQAEWAWPLLEEMMNDPDPKLRSEAFEYGLEKAGKSDITPLKAGMISNYPDIRMKACDKLIKLHTKEAEPFIIAAVDDKEKSIRLKALDAVVAIEDSSDRASKTLTKALTSRYQDVRAGAATARGRQGDPKALNPLLELISAEEPEEARAKSEWMASVEKALEGLGELGDIDALDPVISLIDSKHKSIGTKAAKALAWIVRPEKNEVVKKIMKHSDVTIRHFAGFALACCNDPDSASMVFSDKGKNILGRQTLMAAALALAPDLHGSFDADNYLVSHEDRLTFFLESHRQNISKTALLALMLKELVQNPEQPLRCIGALSAGAPSIRMTAGDGLLAFSDRKTFTDFILNLVNDRGEKPAWKVSGETLKKLGALIIHPEPRIRALSSRMLFLLTGENEKEWKKEWKYFSRRYEKEIAASIKETKAGEKEIKKGKQKKNAKDIPNVMPKDIKEYLNQLAFGAYVGLVREKGTGSGVIRIRQKALARIFEMAEKDAECAIFAQPVFVRALSDPNQPVRIQAFEHMLALGMDVNYVGAEALALSYTDLGVLGLKVITENKTPQEADDIIRGAMMDRIDGLEFEAAKLRLAHLPLAKVCGQAIDAASEKLRKQAVAWLSEVFKTDKEAQKAIFTALDSKYRQIRFLAAKTLSIHKEKKAFDALAALLAETRTISDPMVSQPRIIKAFIDLGDPKAANLFMDRLEDDPAKTADVKKLLDAVAGFRDPGCARRLVDFMQNPAWLKPAYSALYVISGFDQDIDDPDDEYPNEKKWLEKQHPRHDDILADLMEKCLDLNDKNLLKPLIADARWATSSATDTVLSKLAAFPDDSVRHDAIEAIGWRIKNRSCSIQPLVRALEHRDEISRFLAAENLAKAGYDNGITILLTGIDLMSDIDLRMQAVTALGELADERALDILLKLAAEEDHALQESALEAIGHMGRSDKADEIFAILEQYATGSDGLAEMALNGLRWFNTRKGWDLVRQRASDKNWYNKDVAISLLGFNDEPATRTLLLDLIRNDDNYYGVSNAIEAARMLWGPDDPEPDYALLRSLWPEMDEDTLERVCKKGDPERIMEILPHCLSRIRKPLETCLLQRDPLPVDAANNALNSPFAPVVRTGAYIIGRAEGNKNLNTSDLEKAIETWFAKWKKIREDSLEKGIVHLEKIVPVTSCLTQLIWAAGRMKTGLGLILDIAASYPGDSFFRPVAEEALSAIGNFKDDSAKITDFLMTAITSPDAKLRLAATGILAFTDAKAASRTAENMLRDRTGFNRIAALSDVKTAIKKGVSDIHLQAAVLPHLVKNGDFKSVYKVAQDKNLTLNLRMGAVEALAKMADEKAEKLLVNIGKAEDYDEELRKAAWRGLRRSRRARLKIA
ncbi:HEAT repeat domain-containing protein [Desulfobacterales bacterium HSG16]|nr:HEAT repeat domain-containing protein [Desulfobacterales bacterium HSG16]